MAFIDDDYEKQGQSINGFNILSADKLEYFINKHNITIETGRSGVPEYKGVSMGRDGMPLENIYMDSIIDS